MRLIDVSDLDHLTFQVFEEVNGYEPKYAILSHRWEEDEVSYQDVLKRSNVNKSGWAKLKQFCSLIRSRGHRYGWIDTCCIDKTSSAELSEAINSMFMWYNCAKMCYAYLHDVPPTPNSGDRDLSAVAQSEWFNRGWTLQELLSPFDIIFLDQNWHQIGTRNNIFSGLISKVTRIPIRMLHRYYGTNNSVRTNATGSGVGEVMSWAAQRKTTRAEDRAYSLLGLFGIYLPAMYGERNNAFHRLQVQIMESCEDDSIFAWQAPTRFRPETLLAPSLDHFEGCGSRPLELDSLWDKQPRERRMTNRGLRLEPLLRSCYKDEWGEECFLMPLNCTHPNDDSKGMCAAICVQIDRDGKYWRCGDHVKVSGPSLPHSNVWKHSINDRDGFERKVIYARRL